MAHRSILTAAILALLALAGCNRETDGAAQSPSTAASATATAPATATQPAAVAQTAPATGPATTAFANYRVEVSLSPAAQSKLAKDKETIIIAADYYGTPTAAAADQANEVGQLDLGKAEHELAQAGAVDFDANGFMSDRLGLVEGAPEVNINVWSGRHSSPDNLLDCEFFQDALAVAAKAPIRLHCKLIGEP